MFAYAYTSLTAEQAGALVAKHETESLHLDGVTSLSLDAAKVLASHAGERLSLCGLTTLAPQVAAALASSDAFLILNGIATLTPEVAHALAQHGSLLELNGLKTLCDESAEAIAAYKGGRLSLDGLVGISNQAAAAFAKKPFVLSLRGLNALSDQAAESLASREGQIVLECLAGLNSVSLAAKLATQDTSGVDLPGLKSLSPEVAAVLVEHGGPILCLDGLEAISPEVAKILAGFEGELSLDGLQEMCPEVSRALRSGKTRRLYLFGSGQGSALSGPEAMVHVAGKLVRQETIGHVSPEIAEVLAGHTGRIVLPQVTEITIEAAKVLATHTGSSLCLPGLSHITPEVAGALASHKKHLILPGLVNLSTEVARELAKHAGHLSLPGVADLSPGLAEEFAKQRCRTLLFHCDQYAEFDEMDDFLDAYHLYGESAVCISRQMAEALSAVMADYGDVPFRPGITELAPKVSAAICAVVRGPAHGDSAGKVWDTEYVLAKTGGQLSLGGVTTIGADAAKELIKHEGDVFLGGLTTLSAEAAEVLRENPRINTDHT